MALNGTITVSTCGMNVAFGTAATTANSANTNFRATSLYLYNLTAGNSFSLDITTTSGCSTGFTVPPTTMMQFTSLGGITGFSTIASSAAGSMSVSYLASR
jgi:hypothetical protein